MHRPCPTPIVLCASATANDAGTTAFDPHSVLPNLLPRLLAFVRTIVGNTDTAGDLVQEAVARALSARRVSEDGAAYRAWMFTIVRNFKLVAQQGVSRQQWEDMLTLMYEKHGMPALEAKDRETVLTYIEAAYPQRAEERGGWQNPFSNR